MTHRRPAVLPAASVYLWASRKRKVLTVSSSTRFPCVGTSYPNKLTGAWTHFSPAYHRQCLPSHSVAQDVLRGDLYLALVSSLLSPHLPVVLGQICRCHTQNKKKAPGDLRVVRCTQPCQGFQLTWAKFCRAYFHLSLATRQSNKVN